MSSGVRSVPAALAVTALLLSGCTGGDGDSPTPARPTATPLAELDLYGLVGTRAPFCEVLDADATAAVLGGPPRTTAHYGDGDRVRLAPGLTDVAHEDACVFRRGSREARAWVFVQPVRRAEAATLLRERAARPGCEPGGDLRLGRPGRVDVCTRGDRRVVGVAGLLGDAWLTCEVTGPSADPRTEALDRAQRWCVAVADAVAS